METTVSVNKVSFVPKDKDGRDLNVFVFQLTNGKPNIIRRASQFLTDLKGSFLIDDRISNVRHPEVFGVLQDLQAGVFNITGNIKYCKKGDLWTVRENSSVVTDPNHPRYNTVVAGDKLPYETDMTIIEEGFLTIRVNPLRVAINKDSMAKAKLYMAMLEDPIAVDTPQQSQNASSFNEEEIDLDVLNQALGSADTGATDSNADASINDLPEDKGSEKPETAKAEKAKAGKE